MKLIVDRDTFDPWRFHSVAGRASVNVWKQTAGGILVRGEESERRTKGEPETLRRIIGEFGNDIAEACETVNVPAPLVAGMLAAESHGKTDAERPEDHLKDVSIGLTQTLTATAWGLAASAPEELELSAITKLKPMPKGGSLDEWREILRQPFYAIRLGALYFAVANADHDLQLDPVLCYAAYNAGSPRLSSATPWGVHYYRKKLDDGRWADAMDSFSRWYGDACAAYGML